MGFLDLLKGLLPKTPEWDSGSVRHQLLTLRLPTGWQFTRVYPNEFSATGPGGTSLRVTFLPLNKWWSDVTEHLRPHETFSARDEILEVSGKIFKSEPKEGKGPDGILWLEASDFQDNKMRLQIGVVNAKPRDPALANRAVLVHVTCTVPATSTGQGFSAERFDAVRAVVRAAEWN